MEYGVHFTTAFRAAGRSALFLTSTLAADVTVKVPGVAQNLFLLSTGASQGIDS